MFDLASNSFLAATVLEISFETPVKHNLVSLTADPGLLKTVPQLQPCHGRDFCFHSEPIYLLLLSSSEGGGGMSKSLWSDNLKATHPVHPELQEGL